MTFGKRPAFEIAVGQTWRSPDGRTRKVLVLYPKTVVADARARIAEIRGREPKAEIEITTTVNALRSWISSKGAALV